MSGPLPDSFVYSAAWAALAERIAIMETEGLDHRTASLAATRAQLPGDYAEITRLAKEKGLDPETAICELIEELMREEKQARKGAIAGHGEAQTGEGVQTHYQAPENTPKGRETPPGREGLAALEYLLSCGLKIAACYKQDNGDYAFKIPYSNEYHKLLSLDPKTRVSDCKAFTSDIDQVRKYQAQGTKLFRFIPADYNLFCLDIDAKEGKENGLKELFKIFDPELLPAALTDIEGNFPCYVKTPSNGYHLYFKYKGPPIKGAHLFPGIETKHGSPGLNAPGSFKNGKPYVLYGAIDKAPPLYGLIIDQIRKRDNIPDEPPARAAADKRNTPPKRKYEGETPWAKIIEWTEHDNSRDRYAYNLALKAATHKWDIRDTEAALDTMSWDFNNSFTPAQLKKSINSAYHNAKARGKA
jgi:hypothetical protein